MEKHNLRFEFVGMLFALAIGQVAIEFGDLVIHNVNFLIYPNLYSHLSLGTLIITLSWIGWSISKAKGNTEATLSVFSIQFVTLLFDVILVICYFIIVKGAEVPFNSNNSDEISKKLSSTDTSNQIFWSGMIFFFYFIWDILTKLINQGPPKKDGNIFKKNRPFDFKYYSSRAWQTVLCLFLTLIVCKIMSRSTTKVQAVVVDFSLISIFILFRALKYEINKVTSVDKNQLSKQMLSAEIISFADSTIKVEDDPLTYRLKIFFARIFP